jgi:hypothetical protein
MKNYGIDLERERAEQDGSEWKFGATSPQCLAAIPLLDRMKYQPPGEYQFGVEDFMDCATRAPINILAAKFTFRHRRMQFLHENGLWLEQNGYVQNGYVDFSDRFTAILSGTTPQGNSFKAPLESIRKDGLIPKWMLPRDASMNFNRYHNRADITPAMIALGKEFARRFTINYEQVTNIKGHLYTDEVEVGGFAWPPERNGIFGRSEEPMNHAFKVIEPEYLAFDNYKDSNDDFYKNLSPDYKFYDYGYRVILSAETADPVIAQKQGIIAMLFELLGLSRYLKSLQPAAEPPVIQPKPPEIPTPTPKPVPTPTPSITPLSQRLYDVAFASQGMDLSRSAPNEQGCAESLSRLINQVDPGFPIMLSTASMMPALRKRYREVTQPEQGDIAIFPTVGPITGHCGVWGRNHVLNNNSANGKWSASYTLAGWLKAAKNRGLKNYFFRM